MPLNTSHSALIQQGQTQILEQLYRNCSLGEICESIVDLIESAGDGLMCSILEYNAETESLHKLAAPNLPVFYNEAIEGMRVGPGVGACGAAAFIKKRVVTDNLLTHPFWKRARNLVKKTNLRSCWSQPILGYENNLLGTFAIYRDTPQSPTDEEVKLIESAASLAAIAISHKKAEEKRKQLEIELRQQQKLEAVGGLAVGIAHDFRSILATVNDSLIELKNHYQSGRADQRQFASCEDALQQADTLVSQILDFSSHEQEATAPVDLSELVHSTVQAVEQVAPPTITVEAFLPEKPLFIDAATGRIESILHYLCNSALDAISTRGKLQVHLKETTKAKSNFLANHDPAHDRYAKLTIRDSGPGITSSIVDRIFEPFFSASELTATSGMGLSIVYSTVKQHAGYITISSPKGNGRTFTLYFPIIAADQ